MKVILNSADMGMKDELKKAVKYLSSQLETKKAGMHFSRQILSCCGTIDFAAYAKEAFSSVILQLINSNEQELEVKTTMQEIEYFVPALLVAAFNSKSPSTLISRPEFYRKFADAIIMIGGIQKMLYYSLSTIAKEIFWQYLG